MARILIHPIFTRSFKGQLISKGNFSVFNSPKKQTWNVNFCPSLLGKKFLVHFGRIEKKSPFEINWPLGENNSLGTKISSSLLFIQFHPLIDCLHKASFVSNLSLVIPDFPLGMPAGIIGGRGQGGPDPPLPIQGVPA